MAPPSRPTLSDEALLPALRAGEDGAFEEILRRYEGKVYGLVRGLTKNDGDAQDALQDTFLTLVRKIGTFKGASSLSTWIYRVAVNAALMRLRKRRHEARSVPIEEGLPEFDATGHLLASLPDPSPGAEEILKNRELGEQMREAIRSLAPDDRAIVLLRDQEELSTEEVAAIMKLTVPAVKSRLHRARLYLRHRMRAYLTGASP